MATNDQLPKLTLIGSESQAGSYLLRIRVTTDLVLNFGRFKKGKQIAVSKGTYAYVGSALSQKGSTSLGRRLIRHATRTGQKPSQAIRQHLLERFQVVGLGQGDLRPRNGKTLFWNIDHLLDRESVRLTHVIALRSPDRIEASLGQFMMQDKATVIFEAGLGANDVPGNTHILQVVADEAWWIVLPERLGERFQAHL